MRFFLAILSDEKAFAQLGPDDFQKMHQQYSQYTTDLRTAGVWQSGEPLQPSSAGARVQMRTGRRSVTDGPFTEAKELLGGYYILECKSLQEACEWAARCPGAQHGTIEVRAIADMSALKPK